MSASYEIVAVEHLGGHRLRLTFADGLVGDIDASERLRGTVGPMFKPLRDETYFSQVAVDRDLGTIVWPNGADLAPEVLHAEVLGLTSYADRLWCSVRTAWDVRCAAGRTRIRRSVVARSTLGRGRPAPVPVLDAEKAGPGGQTGTTLQSSVTGSTPTAGSSDKPQPGPDIEPTTTPLRVSA